MYVIAVVNDHKNCSFSNLKIFFVSFFYSHDRTPLCSFFLFQTCMKTTFSHHNLKEKNERKKFFGFNSYIILRHVAYKMFGWKVGGGGTKRKRREKKSFNRLFIMVFVCECIGFGDELLSGRTK